MSVLEELKTVEQWEGFFDSFEANLAPMVYDSGENLTFTAVDPHVHSEQTAWACQMQTGIYMPVDGRVYVAVGDHLCSTTMVVGSDGVLIIDPGENDTSWEAAMRDLRRFSDLPIRAVIYTHRHPDHCFAFEGYGVSEQCRVRHDRTQSLTGSRTRIVRSPRRGASSRRGPLADEEPHR